MGLIELSQTAWGLVSACFPKYSASPCGGRPRLDTKSVFEGILYVLNKGCSWNMAPSYYGSKTALNDYYREWQKQGVFNSLLCLQSDNFEVSRIKKIIGGYKPEEVFSDEKL